MKPKEVKEYLDRFVIEQEGVPTATKYVCFNVWGQTAPDCIKQLSAGRCQEGVALQLHGPWVILGLGVHRCSRYWLLDPRLRALQGRGFMRSLQLGEKMPRRSQPSG